MTLLTKRQRDILALLIKEEEYVTVKQIAARFGIAERTVRYDLRWIECWLRENGSGLVKTAGCAGTIDRSAPDFDAERFREALNDIHHRALSAAERRFTILLYLFLEPEAITLRQIAERLNVCKNTVVSDMDAVDGQLAQAGLRLERKIHYGFSLAGAETAIRGFYIRTILDGLARNLISEAHLLVWLKAASPGQLSAIIDEVESELRVEYSDSARKELYISLLVAAHRLLNGRLLPDGPEDGEREDGYRQLGRLYVTWAAGHRIEVPRGELAYIRQIFRGAKLANDRNDVADPAASDAETMLLCQQMIEDARCYLGLDLQNDPELVHGLRTHLKIAVHRLRHNLSVSNPLTDQVKFQMPFFFEMSKKIIAKYEGRIGAAVPDDETAYIAMYFGAAFERSLCSGFMPTALVVCGGGVATSGLLITRLKVMLPEIKLIGPVPAEKIAATLAGTAVDFIIATAPVKGLGKEVVRVNPLLENDDLTRIKTLIFRNSSRKQLQYLSDRNLREAEERWELGELIPREALNLNVECKNWQQAIRCCGQPLLEQGAITEQYVEAMIKAVLDYGPYMVIIPEIALAHAAPEKGVRRECLSLITLRQPLQFGEKNKEWVRIVIVFGARNHQPEQLHRLVKILEQPGNIERIKEATAHDQIMRLSNR
jgi:transcriptional antiterminator/mannitol/fructose-specific phosphotransferase system IIA component (Ntr-type)